MKIVGLLSDEAEADEIKFIAKVFLVATRIHELIEASKKVDK